MPTVEQIIAEGKRLGIVGMDYNYGKRKPELLNIVIEVRLREKAEKLGIKGIHMMNKSVLTEVVEAKLQRPVFIEEEIQWEVIVPKKRIYEKCEHGKREYFCALCKGKGTCEHGANKYICVPCKGKGICEHNTRKFYCLECGGNGTCEHGVQKYSCVPCGGPEICEHKTTRRTCKTCRGKSYCKHDKRKSRCQICDGSEYCEHGKRKYGKKKCIYCVQNKEKADENV